MDLILWRHADAAEGFPDHGRELTPKGQRQAEKMAAFLKAHLPADSRILASPSVRTRQTVRHLTENFTIAPTLAPGADVNAVLQAARWPEEGGTVLIVGHQPTLGMVAGHLMGLDYAALSVRKGSIWWFTRRERAGVQQTVLRVVMSADFL